MTMIVLVATPAWAESHTLPPAQRPEWLAREGIVMAGSWEPLYFRARRDGSKDYTPTPEQRAAYQREHSPEMVARLKNLGINFVMMHCYKGGGLEAERQSMADAVRFARLCHASGLRVGAYALSLEVDGPHGLCAELTQQPGRRMLHLVNYRGDQPARNVCVRMRLPAGRRTNSVILASPEHAADRQLPFREQGGAVTFTVPEVRVYEIAVVGLEERHAGPISDQTAGLGTLVADVAPADEGAGRKACIPTRPAAARSPPV